MAEHDVGRVLGEEPTNEVVHSLDSPQATRPLPTVRVPRWRLGDYLHVGRVGRDGSHEPGLAQHERPDTVSLAQSGQQLDGESLRATRTPKERQVG